MDLNLLFSRHQVSLMKADAANGVESRSAHDADAARYADLIDRLQVESGALSPLSAS